MFLLIWIYEILWNLIVGALFLCLKSVERSHTPADMWQLIQLHDNYEAAFHQVSTALEHWYLKIILLTFAILIS